VTDSSSSYYGRPVIKRPVWKLDIPAYFFCGGVMAGSSLLAAGADVVGNRPLRRAGRVAAAVNLAAGTAFLVHDLGRPERFANMLRVCKPTSPMSVGTWLLAAYGGPVVATAACEVTGRAGGAGRAAGLAAACLAPAVATYTAVLTADTAVPAWHEGWRHLPFLFAGSAAAAAGGLAMAVVDVAHSGPARRMAVGGALVDLVASASMERALGEPVGQAYRGGRAGRAGRWARGLTAAGAVGTVLGGRRSRLLAALSGAALVAGSVCTRLAVFWAGLHSADDPAATVVPQRRRLASASG
jgi:hypothetical protein